MQNRTVYQIATLLTCEAVSRVAALVRTPPPIDDAASRIKAFAPTPGRNIGLVYRLLF